MSQIEAFTETAASLARKVQAGQLKPAEIAEAYSQRTEQWASQLNTHLFFSREQVSREVERVEALLRQKGAAELPLAGVPVLIKDNICTKVPQLDKILNYLEKIAELDEKLQAVPAFENLQQSCFERVDQEGSEQPVEDFLSEAPARSGTSFKVPRIIE